MHHVPDFSFFSQNAPQGQNPFLGCTFVTFLHQKRVFLTISTSKNKLFYKPKVFLRCGYNQYQHWHVNHHLLEIGQNCDTNTRHPQDGIAPTSIVCWCQFLLLRLCWHFVSSFHWNYLQVLRLDWNDSVYTLKYFVWDYSATRGRGQIWKCIPQGNEHPEYF